MNARQRRQFARQGGAFICEVVRALRGLAPVILENPQQAHADFVQIIRGIEETYPKQVNRGGNGNG